MNKCCKNAVMIFMGAYLIGCSSGSSSTTTPVINPQTYGGVNLPALNLYSFQNSNQTIGGVLRLVSESSGLFYISSTGADYSFNLKGAITQFDASKSQCLPATTLSGNLNHKSIQTASVSFDNCSVTKDALVANISISANGTVLYSNKLTMPAAAVVNATVVTQLANSLASTSPVLYNYNTYMAVNSTVISDALGIAASGSTSVVGAMLGNLLLSWTSTESQNIAFGPVSGVGTYKLIDSSSINITVNNPIIAYNGITKQTSGQVLCNVVLSGLVVGGQLNSNITGYITGCSGILDTSYGYINGSLNIK